MKYFIEDTTLTNIADAVREKEESTQPIPVVELAERIRDIQTGSTVGKQLNDDGTQNVFVDDTKSDTIDTGRPIASVKYNGVDVALVGGSGEIPITANGTYDVKKYASANVNVQSAPVLLWTNASPTSAFAAQTVSLPSGYDAYLVEVRYYITNDKTGVGYLRMSDKYQVLSAHNTVNPNGVGASRRIVNTVTSSGIAFGKGYDGNSGSTVNNTSAIPTRIWGVKFTL